MNIAIVIIFGIILGRSVVRASARKRRMHTHERLEDANPLAAEVERLREENARLRNETGRH